jgi:hypothetical protein
MQKHEMLHINIAPNRGIEPRLTRFINTKICAVKADRPSH